MENYFEVKVKYEKIDERGAVKSVTEPYLVDALSCIEACVRATKELEPYLNSDFFITGVSQANYAELSPFEDSDRWFKCKLSYVSLDEEKGTEKRKSVYHLVQANDFDGAKKNLKTSMASCLTDYEVKAIQETNIMDVFPYSAEEIPETLDGAVCEQ